MKKKPAASTQVRLSSELAKELDSMRSNFQFRISRSAFIDVVLRAGIPVIKQQNNLQPSDLVANCPESAWAKK